MLLNPSAGGARLAAWLLLALLLGPAGAAAQPLKPFASDGCSLFPDRSPDGKVDWCACCLAHDLAYWRGGTADERDQADQRFRACVQEKTGNAALATSMYMGVRLGGGSHFPTWYRWGYGWDYGRGYQALTPEEAALAERLEREYREGEAKRGCP